MTRDFVSILLTLHRGTSDYVEMIIQRLQKQYPTYNCVTHVYVNRRCWYKGKVHKKSKKKLTSVSFMYVCVAENVELLVFLLFFAPSP